MPDSAKKQAEAYAAAKVVDTGRAEKALAIAAFRAGYAAALKDVKGET